MAKEMEQNLADKQAAGITLTAEQAAQFKKFQQAQHKAALYTVKVSMQVAWAKAQGYDPKEAEVEAEWKKRQK